MKTEEFNKRLASIKATTEGNENCLEDFERRCTEKLKELEAQRKEVVEQLKQLYTPEPGGSNAECSDGGVTFIVNYSPSDLRDKQNRDYITITVRDRSSGVERGSSEQTDMLVEMVDTGVIDTVNDAKRVAEMVSRLSRFVELADRAVQHYLNWMQNAANQQREFLEDFCNPEAESYW